MKRTHILLVAGVLLAGAAPAAAQVSLELRGGAAVGNATPSSAGLTLAPRPAFGIGVETRAVGPALAYAAYTRASFGCEESFCAGQNVTFTSHGLAAGVRLHPVPVLPWVRGGMLFQGMDTRSRSGTESAGFSPGYELGTGYTVALGERIRLMPGVTYRRHATESGGIDGHAALITAEIGLQYQLRGR